MHYEVKRLQAEQRKYGRRRKSISEQKHRREDGKLMTVSINPVPALLGYPGKQPQTSLWFTGKPLVQSDSSLLCNK